LKKSEERASVYKGIAECCQKQTNKSIVSVGELRNDVIQNDVR
jgi:hypothetical protein